MPITMQVPVIFADNAQTTDAELQLIREMGITNVDLNFGLAQCSEQGVRDILARLARFGLVAGNLSCMPLQKNPSIILGRDDRDEHIERFRDLVRIAAAVGVPVVSVAWQPNGILRTGRAACELSHGGLTGYVEQAEVEARPAANGREYSADEIWDNFAYFLERTVPLCEELGVRMALHPNDPPIPSLAGAASLIWRTSDYNRAFALAGESPALAMKMCVGCWLEGGEAFGNLMDDIADFTRRNKIAVVHFRNVSATLPNFTETLAEDGYANMYRIMRRFVECGYEGLMSVDHVFSDAAQNEGRGTDRPGYVIVALDQDATSNPTMRYAYPTGYAKGLLHAAECELGLR